MFAFLMVALGKTSPPRGQAAFQQLRGVWVSHDVPMALWTVVGGAQLPLTCPKASARTPSSVSDAVRAWAPSPHFSVLVCFGSRWSRPGSGSPSSGPSRTPLGDTEWWRNFTNAVSLIPLKMCVPLQNLPLHPRTLWANSGITAQTQRQRGHLR